MSNADPVREIFREALESIELHGFNPHSVLHSLAMLGEQRCKTPEEFKAHDTAFVRIGTTGSGVIPH